MDAQKIANLIVGDAYKRQDIYKERVEYSNRIKRLITKDFVKELLGQRHPSEDEFIREHRLQNFRLITLPYYDKILKGVSRIGNAAQFTTTFPEMAGVPENETLEAYCTLNYPEFDSVNNWLFTYGLKAIMQEPNGVAVVMPAKFAESEQEYQKPVIFCIEAYEVIHFDSELLIFEYEDVYYAIDRTEIAIVTKSNKGVNITPIYTHNFGEIPAFWLGGERVVEEEMLYASFVDGIVENFTEALVQYSDLQGGLKNHIYPQKHVFVTDECSTCNGSGKIYNGENNTSITCNGCNGSGYVKPSGVYGVVVQRPSHVGEMGDIPFPAAAYVTTPIDGVQFLSEQIQKNLHDGLAAVSFEFIHETPATQSGVAKEYDRTELDVFISNIARHLVQNILKPAYWYISKWRYGVRYNMNETALNEIQPKIAIPRKFDIIGASILENEIRSAKEAGVDGKTIAAMQVLLAEKKFEDNEYLRNLAVLAIKLNPFIDKTVDEIAMLNSIGAVTREDVIIHSNINDFTKRALEQYPEFMAFHYTRQRAILQGYARELVGSMREIQTPLTPPPVE